MQHTLNICHGQSFSKKKILVNYFTFGESQKFDPLRTVIFISLIYQSYKLLYIQRNMLTEIYS